MNAAKFINLSPTLLVVACLGYAVYAGHSTLNDAATLSPAGPKSQDNLAANRNQPTVSEVSEPSGGLRDPFQVVQKPAKPADNNPTDQDKGALASEPDPLLEVVGGLTLGATFLQGRHQIAIIDGRTYAQGQHILVTGDRGESDSTLFVAKVLHTKVILQAGGKHYELTYPDQLGVRRTTGRDERRLTRPTGILAAQAPGKTPHPAYGQSRRPSGRNGDSPAPRALPMESGLSASPRKRPE
jgi:hypothetical protein